jgi:hypothetical protein
MVEQAFSEVDFYAEKRTKELLGPAESAKALT